MFYETEGQGHGLPIDPIKAIVAPRPIAWVSTIDEAGRANLAPYSFFNIFSEQPYYVAFGSSGWKDSLRNAEASGEFAVNIVSEPLRDAMNISSAGVPQGVDEFELAGLSKAACRMISVPRVATAVACLECKLHQVIPLPDDSGHAENWMVLGRVVGVHIDDSHIVQGRVDTASMKLVARLGYADYLTANSLWRMKRPGQA